MGLCFHIGMWSLFYAVDIAGCCSHLVTLVHKTFFPVVLWKKLLGQLQELCSVCFGVQQLSIKHDVFIFHNIKTSSQLLKYDGDYMTRVHVHFLATEYDILSIWGHDTVYEVWYLTFNFVCFWCWFPRGKLEVLSLFMIQLKQQLNIQLVGYYPLHAVFNSWDFYVYVYYTRMLLWGLFEISQVILCPSCQVETI